MSQIPFMQQLETHGNELEVRELLQKTSIMENTLTLP